MRVLAAVLLTAAPAFAGPDVTVDTWSCEGGVTLQSAYIAALKGPVAVIAVNGFLIPMSAEAATEGMKFAGPSPDAEGSDSVWWDKGDSALFLTRANGVEAPVAFCTRAK